MFLQLFLISEEIRDQGLVFLRGHTAGTSTTDRAKDDLAFLETDEDFGGRADERQIIELEEEEIGRWVQRTKGAVEIGGPSLEGNREPLADYRLLDLTLSDRSLNTPDIGLEILPRMTTLELRRRRDRKSTRLNSSHVAISYAVFCL